MNIEVLLSCNRTYRSHMHWHTVHSTCKYQYQRSITLYTLQYLGSISECIWTKCLFQTCLLFVSVMVPNLLLLKQLKAIAPLCPPPIPPPPNCGQPGIYHAITIQNMTYTYTHTHIHTHTHTHAPHTHEMNTHSVHG